MDPFIIQLLARILLYNNDFPTSYRLLSSNHAHFALLEPLLKELGLLLDNTYEWASFGRLTYLAIKCNCPYIFNLAIKSGFNDWNSALGDACYFGISPLVDQLIDKGANNWNGALVNACLGGHLELAQLMIDKGANNWNRALIYACEGGHLELTKLMIDKGANDWNLALLCASRGGHCELAQLMINKGANNWYYPLHNALAINNFQLVKLLVQRGATVGEICLANYPRLSPQIIVYLKSLSSS